jgi:hypothetical protein
LKLTRWLPAASLVLCFRAWGATDAERAAAAGELLTVNGLPVLRLFGAEPRERGFAHGYLLGAETVACIEDALRSLPLLTVERFEQRLVPWATRQFNWDADAVAELEGLFAGVRARLGEAGLCCAALGRALRQEDFYAINCIADYFGPSCSAFTAWGAMTVGGQVLHARNLDFPLGPAASARQVVLAVKGLPARGAQPARRAWVGVGWPGLICAYSAMNSEGLVCCLHDAMNVVAGGADEDFVARGLLLRRIIETLDPAAADPALAAAKMAAVKPVACGNLFHLSWPRAAAATTDTAPTAVLEFDAQDRRPGRTPVVIRRPGEANSLIVTNHYCVRRPPLRCGRFAQLEHAMLVVRGSALLDPASARKALIGAEQSVVAHTIVFLPDERALTVSITRGNVLSTRLPGALLKWDELFGPQPRRTQQ